MKIGGDHRHRAVGGMPNHSRTRSSIVALTNSKPCIRRRAPINASGFW